jgi:hypothetical protein
MVENFHSNKKVGIVKNNGFPTCKGPFHNHVPKLWKLIIELYLFNWLHKSKVSRISLKILKKVIFQGEKTKHISKLCSQLKSSKKETC